MPKSVILSFTETHYDDQNIIINDTLLFYKHYLCKPEDSESLSFIDIKNNNLKTKILKKMLAGNVLRKRLTCTKKWQVISYDYLTVNNLEVIIGLESIIVGSCNLFLLYIKKEGIFVVVCFLISDFNDFL